MIPACLALDFSESTPHDPSLDAVPEPEGGRAQNGLYFGIRDKIVAQKKQLEDLPPLGDKDMDRRREVLIEEATSHLELLEQIKANAWTDYVLTDILAKSSDNKGPIVVTAGI